MLWSLRRSSLPRRRGMLAGSSPGTGSRPSPRRSVPSALTSTRDSPRPRMGRGIGATRVVLPSASALEQERVRELLPRVQSKPPAVTGAMVSHRRGCIKAMMGEPRPLATRDPLHRRKSVTKTLPMRAYELAVPSCFLMCLSTCPAHIVNEPLSDLTAEIIVDQRSFTTVPVPPPKVSRGWRKIASPSPSHISYDGYAQ